MAAGTPETMLTAVIAGSTKMAYRSSKARMQAPDPVC
jgi:hypothetical protein